MENEDIKKIKDGSVKKSKVKKYFLILLAAIISIIAVVFAYFGKNEVLNRGKSADVTIAQKTEDVFIPGTSSDEDIVNIQKAENKKNEEEARKNGGSSIAIPVLEKDKVPDNFDLKTADDVYQPKKIEADNVVANTSELVEKLEEKPAPIIEKKEVETVEHEKEDVKVRAPVDNSFNSVAKESNPLQPLDIEFEKNSGGSIFIEVPFVNTGKPSNQNSGDGVVNTEQLSSTKNSVNTQTQTLSEDGLPYEEPSLKQGKGKYIDIGARVPAILTFGINTDNPSPVEATIHSGKLAGAVAFGNISELPGGLEDPRTNAVLKFDQIKTRDGNLYEIEAYALDMNNGESGLGSSIDRHIMLKLAGVFLSSASGQYSDALMNRRGSQYIYGNNSSSVVEDKMSNKDIVRSSAASAGAQIGGLITQLANRPTTIKVEKGTRFYLYFTKSL